jgi:hypothetical protein
MLEYKNETYNSTANISLVEWLNLLNKEKWEVVCFLKQNENLMTFLFKRKVESKSKFWRW